MCRYSPLVLAIFIAALCVWISTSTVAPPRFDLFGVDAVTSGISTWEIWFYWVTGLYLVIGALDALVHQCHESKSKAVVHTFLDGLIMILVPIFVSEFFRESKGYYPASHGVEYSYFVVFGLLPVLALVLGIRVANISSIREQKLARDSGVSARYGDTSGGVPL
ncbi:hypothetical protein ACUH90_08160 [Dermabacteraceae bacterium P7054]